MNKRISSYVFLTLAMFISGSAVVVYKIMVNTIPNFLATEIGILLGLVILIPVTFFIKKDYCSLDKKTIFVIFIQAFCGIVMYRVFTFWGLKYTSAANSGLITSCSPAVVVILACIFLKERVGRNGLIGLIMILTGLFTINFYTYINEAGGKSSFLGNMMIMVAVICEALFSILSKVKCKKISPLYRTTIIVCFAFVMLLPFAVHDGMNYNFSEMPKSTVYSLLYYGIFVSYLSYIFWFKGIEKVQASKAAVFTSVVPVSSILLAVLILKESLNIVHIAGMIFIILGILISCKK